MNEEPKKKCEICNDSGWVPYSEFKNKRKEYEEFKIIVFTECSCKKEARSA